MACLISFSRRLSLICARQYCKIPQHSSFENNYALLNGKECVSFVGQRYFSTEDANRTSLEPDVVDEETPNCIRDATNPLREIAAEPKERKFIIGDLSTHKTIACIRQSTLKIENFLVDELSKSLLSLDDPLLTTKMPRTYPSNLYYFEERWLKILQRTDNPYVKRLLTLIEMADFSPEEFSGAMSIFSTFPPVNIEVRPLKEFTHDEIAFALHCRYRLEEGADDLIKCVTHVLMKF